MTDPQARFERAVAIFDARNAQDPKKVLDGGVERPHTLVEAERLSRWVERLDPHASEAVRLAARCQHLERWRISRDEYPRDKSGYLTWRTTLARFHAEQAAEVLAQVGYDAETIEQVRAINLKRGLRRNADVQLIEDALCLTFLEHDAEAFAAKHPDDKVVEIIAKSWNKMSERGRQAALGLSLPARLRSLVERALA